MKKTLFLLLAALAVQATEIPLDTARFSPKDTATVRNADGKLVINFPAYNRNWKNTWPSVSVALPPDCSAWTHVELDLALSGGLTQCIAVKFNDREKGKYFEYHAIPDRNPLTLRVALHPVQLNLKNMGTMTLYQSRAPFDSQFTVTGIRLINTKAEQLASLAVAAAKFGIRKTPEELREMTSADVERLEETLRKEEIAVLQKESERRSGAKSFAAGVTGRLEKPMPMRGLFSADTPKSAEVSLARNEAENLQFLTISSQKMDKMSIRASGFPKTFTVTAAPIGLVNVTASRAPQAVMGYHFDPILEFTDSVSDLKPEQLQSWLVRIKAPADAPAGKHHGKVEFFANGEKMVYPVEVTVYDFTLPSRLTLKTATSVYSSKVLGKYKQPMKKYILKNYHLNYFSIYSEDGSYGKPTLPSIQEYLEAKKIGANFIPILYLKLPRQALHTGLGYTPERSKAEWEKLPVEKQQHYPVEWKNKYLEILSRRIPELKAAGLYDIAACYGFDEATPSEWPAIAELLAELKAKFPDLKVVSTAVDFSYGERSVLGKHLDGWIAGIGTYRPDAAKVARAKGREIWYYTTRMTIDGTALPDIRGEVGERAIANGVNGWLIWTVSRWYNNPKPITTSPITGWNPESFPGDNGGGSYFCMGPNGQFLPTLRAEAIRDGIEDYEYFTILRRKAEKRSKSDPRRLKAEKLLNTLPMKPGAIGTNLLNRRNNAAKLIESMN